MKQTIDEFTTAEIAQAEAELQGLADTRTTATRDEMMRGFRVIPGGGSDLLRAYVEAWRRGRSRRRHLNPIGQRAEDRWRDARVRRVLASRGPYAT